MHVIITGATKGIGRALVERFAQAGFNLIICARTAKDLEQVKQDIESRFPTVKVHYQAVDFGDKKQVLSFVEFVKQQASTIDVLINNVGFFQPIALQDEPDGFLEKVMAINVFGPYHLTKGLLAQFIAQKAGYIFNICSVASLQAYPMCGSYTLTKHALHGFSKTLRNDLKQHNIRVTSVLPGATFTASWELSGVPPERIMPAEDIAAAVYSCYELSDKTVVEDLVLRPLLGDL